MLPATQSFHKPNNFFGNILAADTETSYRDAFDVNFCLLGLVIAENSKMIRRDNENLASKFSLLGHPPDPPTSPPKRPLQLRRSSGMEPWRMVGRRCGLLGLREKAVKRN